MILKSHISPKARRGSASKIHGGGMFAEEKIAKDEIIAIKAGHIINKKTLTEKAQIIKDSFAQIGDDLFIASLNDEEWAGCMTYINHSCEPNAGMGGNILIVAMRDIEPGEEITVDYATQWADPELSISPCNCGSEICRKSLSGNDWKMPELQKRYSGYFSWYIDQKIRAHNS